MRFSGDGVLGGSMCKLDIRQHLLGTARTVDELFYDPLVPLAELQDFQDSRDNRLRRRLENALPVYVSSA